jgi:streptogramin lyase
MRSALGLRRPGSAVRGHQPIDENTYTVNRYSGTDGSFMDFFVPARSGGLSRPRGVLFGPDGNLYVSSYDTGQVLRYDGSTGDFIDVFASGGGLANPKAWSSVQTAISTLPRRTPLLPRFSVTTQPVNSWTSLFLQKPTAGSSTRTASCSGQTETCVWVIRTMCRSGKPLRN